MKNGVWLKKHLYFWLGIAGFLVTIVFVNPLRETVIGDDYAYALTVKHLVETGTYRLHEWVGANMIFQAYWGALFCKIFGYSFSTLQISTLLLALLGFISFYFLLREHGLDPVAGGLLTICLFASPIVLYLSFSFMTDVPFLSCLIMALLFYSRGLRMRKNFLMFFGSIAASAAILIRQPGVAIPAGLFVQWLFDKKGNRQWHLLLTGLVLPVAAGIWVTASAIFRPNFGARYLLLMQSIYLQSKLSALLVAMFWRLTVMLHYLAIFVFPLLFVFVVAFLLKPKTGSTVAPEERRKKRYLWVLSGAIVFAGIFAGHAHMGSYFMPYLPWYFVVLQFHPVARVLVTILTTTGAILLAWILIQRTQPENDTSADTSRRLLGFVTLFLLVSTLLFGKLGDKYILVFLPFTLIALGRHMAGRLNHFRITTAIACFVMLIASAFWTRGLVAHAEALWKGCEMVRATGVDARLISGPWTWVSYYNFEDYLQEIRYNVSANTYTDFFFRWLPERRERSQFQVDDLPPKPTEKWRTISEIPFRGISLRQRRVFIYERIQ